MPKSKQPAKSATGLAPVALAAGHDLLPAPCHQHVDCSAHLLRHKLRRHGLDLKLLQLRQHAARVGLQRLDVLAQCAVGALQVVEVAAVQLA
jgi:hypothetical protein